MDVPIAHIIPDLLRLNLNGVGVECHEIVLARVLRVVPATAYKATDEADP